MKDIKRKFIDILFEPEENEVEIFEEPKKKKKKEVNIDTSVSAKDLLYKKGESAFINLDEPKKNERKVIETPNGEYEFSSQISPIFGVIKENEFKMTKKSDPDARIVNKPDSSHLEIITSPIYGYAKQSDQIDTVEYGNNMTDPDEKELHELLDNDNDHTYDDFTQDDEINLFNYGEDE